MTPAVYSTRGFYGRFLLRHVQREFLRFNPPDSYRTPKLLWSEVFDRHDPFRRKHIYDIASELNRICQSHAISLVDGEGQGIDACRISEGCRDWFRFLILLIYPQLMISTSYNITIQSSVRYDLSVRFGFGTAESRHVKFIRPVSGSCSLTHTINMT